MSGRRSRPAIAGVWGRSPQVGKQKAQGRPRLPESPLKRSSACSPDRTPGVVLFGLSTDASLAYQASGLVRHLRPSPDPGGGSHSSRCRSHLQEPRFLAASASIARSPGAARWLVRDGLRWLPTPCALRLREPDPMPRSLTSSVAAAVLTRGLHPSRSPPATRLASRDPLPAAARTRPAPARFRRVSLLIQDAFLRSRSSTSRSRETPRTFTCRSRARRLAPFRSSRGGVALSGCDASAPRYLTSSRSASRLASIAGGRCFSPTSASDSRHEHP